MVTIEMAISAMASIVILMTAVIGWVGKMIWERVAKRLDGIESRVLSLFPQVEADIKALKESQSEIKIEIRRLGEFNSEFSDMKTQVALLRHIVENEIKR